MGILRIGRLSGILIEYRRRKLRYDRDTGTANYFYNGVKKWSRDLR